MKFSAIYYYNALSRRHRPNCFAFLMPFSRAVVDRMQLLREYFIKYIFFIDYYVRLSVNFSYFVFNLASYNIVNSRIRVKYLILKLSTPQAYTGSKSHLNGKKNEMYII